MFDWTDERIALLTRLWGEGGSCAQIAGEMGGGLSRSAIIGKVHRLGLETRMDGSDAAKAARHRKRVEKTRLRRAFLTGDRSALDAPLSTRSGPPMASTHRSLGLPLAPEPAPTAPPATAIPFSGLDRFATGPKLCRFPYGESPNLLFCGAPVAEGLSYCPGHCRIVFQPPAPRRVSA